MSSFSASICRVRLNDLSGRFFSTANKTPTFSFSMTPTASSNSQQKCIKTAAALVIGDEILNGKTLDKNSHFFARYCFEHGVQLQRIEVIADNEDQIVEASRRMVSNYDLVVTSGGIGPTHDDITYASLAKAFSQPLASHAETQRRMDIMNQHKQWINQQNSSQRAAMSRMALLPADAEVMYVTEDLWVPVVRLEQKLCILPGIPSLFQKLLHGLSKYLVFPPECDRPIRVQVFTENSESMIAPYLSKLQEKLKASEIQIGSYPAIGQGVFVSLIGPSQSRSQTMCVSEVAKRVASEIQGCVVTPQEVEQRKNDARNKEQDI